MTRFYGWTPSRPDQRDVFYSAPRRLLESLPASKDLSVPALPFPFEPSLDQLNEGSCGPNSETEDIVFSAIAQGVSSIALPSRQFIYYTTRMIMGTTGYDSGVDNRSMCRALAKYGWCDEIDWPYDVSKLTVKPPQSCFDAAIKRANSTYQAVPQTLQQMKSVLASGDTFIYGFTVYESFESDAVTETGDVPMPRSSESVLGGHDVLLCFTGDTKVSLMDGTEHSLSDLAAGSAGEEFWVYSCDKDGNVVPGRAHSARKTGEKQKLVEVTLDNGETVRCTTNHPFLLRDGTYKEARSLVTGDSLMPLYRKLSTDKGMSGYEKVYNPASKKWRFTHRLSAAWAHGGRYTGEVVHHRNFNKRDNTPENLEVMSWEAHTRLHAEETEALRRYAQSEEGRNKSREVINRLWADPEWRARMVKQLGENGRTACKKRAARGECGFQTMDRERLKEMTRANGKKGKGKKVPASTRAKISTSWKRRLVEDAAFREEQRARGRLACAASAKKQREQGCTERQIAARRENIRRCHAAMSPEVRQLTALKTAYTRFHQGEYASFEEYLVSKGIVLEPNNHKVVSVRPCGEEDVFDITVDKYHNFALTAGVFVHNCGYDDATQRFKFKNSWGTGWGRAGYGTMPYAYATSPQLSGDFWTVQHVPLVGPTPPPPPPPPPGAWTLPSKGTYETGLTTDGRPKIIFN